MPVKIIKTFFILFLFVFIQTQLQAQFKCSVSGTVTNSDKSKLENAVVALYKGKSVIQQISTPSTGKFSFNLEPNAEYTVSVTRAGYITKKIVISTMSISDATAKNFNKPLKTDVEIFEMPKDPSLVSQINSILSQPVGRLYFDPVKDDVVNDESYASSIASALERLKNLQEEADKKAEEENAKYKAAIKLGDDAFNKKDYGGAKISYSLASSIKSFEQYPKDKIAECDRLAADAANAGERDAKFKAALAKADAAFGTKDYSNAKSGYNEALAIKTNEQYPKDQLSKIDKLLGDASKANELDEKYKAALAKGDAAFGSKDYAPAKAAFNEALGIKSKEQYPKDKIAEIDKLLADIANKEKANKDLNEKYLAAISKADDAFGKKDYSNAKSFYNNALGLKPAEQYPVGKIKECEDFLAKDANAKKLEDDYKAAISKADKALSSKDYSIAKTGYQNASGLKPNEQYPKDKLLEIEKLLGDANAEKDRLAKEKELNDKYNAAISKGDASFGSKNYVDAKSAYNEALTLKSEEKYPKEKIAECEKLLSKLMGEKELNDKYNASIAKADAAFGSKDYTSAKVAYNEALGYKSSEKYPKEKISEIEKLLADAAAKDKSEKEINEKYIAAIAKADEAMGKKDYSNAKSFYNNALGLKPSEQYPKDKIKECDDILAKDADAKKLEEEYKALITKADKAFSTKDYALAKSSYTNAIGLKPNEQYPKDKLSEVEKLISKDLGEKELNQKYNEAIAKADASFGSKEYNTAKISYTEALALKPSEKYPKDKITECDKLISEHLAELQLTEKYNAAITKADGAFSAKDLSNAKLFYKDALDLKSDETYPKDKIAEIDAMLLNDMSEKQIAAKYAAAIAKADKSFDSKTYNEAKKNYNEALSLKPGEQYPKDKIASIEEILSKEMLDKNYADAIKKADAAFDSKDLATAKSNYNEALNLKPTEQYPKDKLAEIEAILAKEMSAKQLEENYKSAIVKADAAFYSKDYETANTSYVEATTLKPNEKYPKDQLQKLSAFLAEQNKYKSINEKYNSAIAKADAAYTTKDYKNSLVFYKEALTIKPTEVYPSQKISDINKLLDDEARANGKELRYKGILENGDKALAAKDYRKAKNFYVDALLLKPSEQYPKDKIEECDANLKTTNTVITPIETKKDATKNELAQKYPEGVTEEYDSEKNAKLVKRIVVHGNEGHMYIQKTTSFGPIYFFRDNVPITEQEYNSKTSE